MAVSLPALKGGAGSRGQQQRCLLAAPARPEPRPAGVPHRCCPTRLLGGLACVFGELQ